ncbi:DUF4136 domain-containing protein [Spirosoma foliorum]|uniref:DUF4136 domain-containing protein n=2 Tax=Spirosoma foliorum TaxID=2710596 RepID=A0A7G5GX91_9BACT|nr:DUF4136 domain-containing protein [Spirosoma foliorum]
MHMKRLFFVAAFALATSLTQAQNVTVDSELRPNIDFSHFKSYAWAVQPTSKQDAGNALALKAQMRDAVANAMDGRGYTFNRQSPDLIVNFRVLDQPTTLKGYTEGTSYFNTNDVQSLGKEKDIVVQAGTILVNLVDAKTDEAIWQGIASGLITANNRDHQEGKIREAINLIFNKYPYRADSY